MRGEAGLCQAADVLQHAVDVDRPALDRLVAERLHPVHQSADTVGLVADQNGQLAVRLGHAALEQLCGTADAGERVLHLVRQNGGHAADGAGG